MANHVEMEMNSCLTEMERLQEKMMELQATKKKHDAEQEEKTNKIEPNLAIMEKWLDIYHFNQEQKKLSDVAKKNYDDYLARLRKRIGGVNVALFRDPFQEEVVGRRNSQYKPLSEEEEEERKKIVGDYRQYCRVPNTKPIQTFSMPNNNTPSQFMIDFIEATHNLFQIQKKRIDELETVVNELNSKIIL